MKFGEKMIKFLYFDNHRICLDLEKDIIFFQKYNKASVKYETIFNCVGEEKRKLLETFCKEFIRTYDHSVEMYLEEQ